MDNQIFAQIKAYTPCYLLDVDELKKRVKYLREKLPEKIELCFAMKANSFVIKELEDLVERFEVCSFGEYQICKLQNIDPKKLVISGVHKEVQELREIVKHDCGIYTAESMQQFNLLKDLSQNIQVLLRLTSGNQFGMSEEEIEEIIKNREKYPYLKIVGLEYFSGTQKSERKIVRELEYLDSFIQKMENDYGFKIKELEYGGGFPIQYYEGEENKEEDYLQTFYDCVMNLVFQGRFILELGRSIAASCGSYVTKICDIKSNKNGNFALADGGMHQLVYYGSGLAMKQPILEVKPYRSDNIKDYNVCGSLCTINDFLVKHLEADLRVGDYLIFKNTGAYSLTEGISLFLSRDLPRIFMHKEGKIVMLRDKFDTYSFNTFRKEDESWKD